MDEASNLSPTESSDPMGNETGNRKSKLKIGIIVAVFVLLAGSAVAFSVVSRISPDVELVNAYNNTFSSTSNLDVNLSVYQSPESLRQLTNLTDAEVAKAGIGSIKTVDEMSAQLNKLGLRIGTNQTANKDNPSFAVGLTYGNLDVLMMTVVNRVLYVHTDASQIASQTPNPWTKENIQSLSDYAKQAYSDSPKLSDLLVQFLQGTPVFYPLAKGTAAGDYFDKYLASTQAKSNPVLTPAELKQTKTAVEKALRDNGQITRIGKDVNGDKILVSLKLKDFVKQLRPEIEASLSPKGNEQGLASALGISSMKEVDSVIANLTETLNATVWVKDNKISLLQVDMGSLISKIDPSNKNTISDHAIYMSLKINNASAIVAPSGAIAFDSAPLTDTVKNNQLSRAYLGSAREDAHSLGTEVYSILSDYTSLGSRPGTITIDKGFLTFSKMQGATGTSIALASGPGVTPSAPVLSSGSSFIGNWGTDGTMRFCLVVTNHSTYVKYTEQGEASSSIGGTPPTCVLGS